LSTGFETFVPVYFSQWTTNRKWLVYSDEENKMYCTLCKNGNVDSVFTKGTNNMKLEAVKQHVRSSCLVSSFDWWFTYLWDQMIHETYLHNLHMKRTQWTTNRKWLVYSDEENKMYCTLCKNGNVDSVFTLLA
jgi:NAD-dependent dihydropyrimidine dehydrogenase PreA subunit